MYMIVQGNTRFEFVNPVLEKFGGDSAVKYARNNEGSVIGAIGLPGGVFDTAFEMDMEEHVDRVSRYQSYVDQAISLDIYMDNPTAKEVHNVHYNAWSGGIKTLYYFRQPEALSIDSGSGIDPSCGCPINPVEREECTACEG